MLPGICSSPISGIPNTRFPEPKKLNAAAFPEEAAALEIQALFVLFRPSADLSGKRLFGIFWEERGLEGIPC